MSSLSNLENKINYFIDKKHQLSFNGLKYLTLPIIFFLIASFAGPIMIANHGVSDSYLGLTLPLCMIIGGIPCAYASWVIVIKEEAVDDEINEFIKEFNALGIKDELNQLYEARISVINNQTDNSPINKIMLIKANEYYKNFLFDMERRVNKDWDYFYALYKHVYFFKHLESIESFRKLDEKRFEIVYDPL